VTSRTGRPSGLLSLREKSTSADAARAPIREPSGGSTIARGGDGVSVAVVQDRTSQWRIRLPLRPIRPECAESQRPDRPSRLAAMFRDSFVGCNGVERRERVPLRGSTERDAGVLSSSPCATGQPAGPRVTSAPRKRPKERLGQPSPAECSDDRHKRLAPGGDLVDDRGVTQNPESAAPPFGWVRVVDLTDLRGAMAARMLADLGADVIRVERPGPAAATATTAHRYRNANKRGVVLDPASEPGRARLQSLLSEADVLVENLDATERAELGFQPEPIAEQFPGLVHVAIADAGLAGPRSTWRLEPLPALAASGTLHASGPADLPPCNAPGWLAHDSASIYAAVGAAAAVLDKARHGKGQLVEVSVQEAALAASVPWSIPMRDYLRIDPWLPVEGKRNGDGSYWVLPAKDGWIRTVTGTQRHWDGFVKLLGSPDVLTGPEWQDRFFRLMNSDVMRIVAQDALLDRTRAELFEEAEQLFTAVGVLNSVSEFVRHPQTQGRGFFSSTGYPGLGDAPFAGHPVNLSATPASIRRPAPDPGQDDGTGFADRVAPVAGVGGVGEGLLLKGVRVVEIAFGQLVPQLCGVLSEFGADVIKIESLAHPDLLRAAGGGRINCSFAFNSEARGRRSVALDLRTEEGRRIAMELCSAADVVAENHRGGVLDGLGLGYEDVKKRNPSVVYVSSQGYGRGGPLGRRQAYGPLNAAFAGAQVLWNHPEAPYPAGTTLTYPDCIGGKVLALSVLGALHHRAVTGDGQHIEMAQTEVVAYFLGQFYIDAHLNGSDPQPIGNRHPGAAPHGVYPARGDDKWVAIAVMDNRDWSRLCELLSWGDGWASWSLGQRLEAQDSIDKRLSEWTVERPGSDTAELLQSRGISAMPVMGPEDHHADPHLRERNFIVRLEHPEVGEEHHAGNPIRMSRLELRVGASSPCLGADTDEVLRSVLGLSEGDVADLRAQGVCY
jgi:crotonobetainyl-CoA:carnitine CoA-transferase CaiB-like acyl-CoA transferase